jgi:hypothetical protein
MPGDEVTWQEAAAILGVGIRRVGVLVAQGELAGAALATPATLPLRGRGAGAAPLEPPHRCSGLLLARHKGSGADARRKPGARVRQLVAANPRRLQRRQPLYPTTSTLPSGLSLATP